MGATEASVSRFGTGSLSCSQILPEPLEVVQILQLVSYNESRSPLTGLSKSHTYLCCCGSFHELLTCINKMVPSL